MRRWCSDWWEGEKREEEEQGEGKGGGGGGGGGGREVTIGSHFTCMFQFSLLPDLK